MNFLRTPCQSIIYTTIIKVRKRSLRLVEIAAPTPRRATSSNIQSAIFNIFCSGRDQFHIRDNTEVAESTLFYNLDLNFLDDLADLIKPFDLAGQGVVIFGGGDGIPDGFSLRATGAFDGLANNHESIVGGRAHHIRLDLIAALIFLEKGLHFRPGVVAV